jgi:rSAM/selenodomain-associated transferase 1
MSVFYAGGSPEQLTTLAPKHAALVAQVEGTLGDRLAAAFGHLLESDGPAVVIGTDSPDIPVQYIKRAFTKLKHKDVVLGPAADGGYYLIGMRKPDPRVFENIRWGESTVFADTLTAIENADLSLATLPIWYDVDDEASLATLKSMAQARRLERRDRLHAIETVLDKLDL